MGQTGTLKTPTHQTKSGVHPQETQRQIRYPSANTFDQISNNKTLNKNRKPKRRGRIRLLKLGLLCLTVFLLICFGKNIAEDFRVSNQSNVNAQASDPTQGKTILDKEIEKKLQVLAQSSSDIAEVYMDMNSYPPELLKALALNPEMLDFVRGWPDSDGSVTGGFTEAELDQDHPLLMQWDSRWGYYAYGESNIGLAGCGPVCLSMVILSLTGNEDATPDKLADYSMKNGHYVSGTGTAWSLMTAAPTAYDISARELGLDENVMKQLLNQGGMIICAMRPGDFTTTGHFIVIYDYNKYGFLVNDPNSRERSDKTWPFSTLKTQIKNLWGFKIS